MQSKLCAYNSPHETVSFVSHTSCSTTRDLVALLGTKLEKQTQTLVAFDSDEEVFVYDLEREKPIFRHFFGSETQNRNIQAVLSEKNSTVLELEVVIWNIQLDKPTKGQHLPAVTTMYSQKNDIIARVLVFRHLVFLQYLYSNLHVWDTQTNKIEPIVTRYAAHMDIKHLDEERFFICCNDGYIHFYYYHNLDIEPERIFIPNSLYFKADIWKTNYKLLVAQENTLFITIASSNSREFEQKCTVKSVERIIWVRAVDEKAVIATKIGQLLLVDVETGNVEAVIGTVNQTHVPFTVNKNLVIFIDKEEEVAVVYDCTMRTRVRTIPGQFKGHCLFDTFLEINSKMYNCINIIALK